LEREDKSENAIRVESIYGAYSRSFVLPDYVDAKGIQAESKDGVLRIHIPKPRRTAARWIGHPSCQFVGVVNS
jgi:HSP20 family protein